MLSVSDILEKKARMCKEKGQKYYRLCKKYQELTEFYFKKSELFLECVNACKEIEIKEDENSCPICYSSYKIYVHGSCDHKVCVDCYTKLKEGTEKCPICRETFSNKFDKQLNEINFVQLSPTQNVNFIYMNELLNNQFHQILNPEEL